MGDNILTRLRAHCANASCGKRRKDVEDDPMVLQTYSTAGRLSVPFTAETLCECGTSAVTLTERSR